MKYHPTNAAAVQVTVDTLTVDLADGRSISAPLAWYPRLGHGTAAERADWRLIGAVWCSTIRPANGIHEASMPFTNPRAWRRSRPRSESRDRR